MSLAQKSTIWGTLIIAISVPIALAGTSPLIAFREPIYIVAGIAGVVALAVLLVQPVLVAGYLPSLRGRRGRNVHRWVGVGLVAMVLVHVVGLWITSPPDVIDALFFMSATPFSAWGVISMWSVLAAALLGVLRRRLHLQPRLFRRSHSTLAVIVVITSVVHALQIEGTMEKVSKAVLCSLIVAATLKALIDLRIWNTRRQSN